jgi:hydrogenase maturation protein HypF
MQRRGKIIIRGIVQGVGFRPFVYAKASEFGICGSVRNLGSEVEIRASGVHFEEFVRAVTRGPPLSRIDQVTLSPLDEEIGEGFAILPSTPGTLSGMIPPDIATCDACLKDITDPGGRYSDYWATSCVNCGPRYSIIRHLPYDRERTSMDVFPKCAACQGEYVDPACRRHHAQTIACADCGPGLRLLDPSGTKITVPDVIRETARFLDLGFIIAVRGVGGFHIACTEERAGELKRRLGRSEQPFAVMVRPGEIDEIARVTPLDHDFLRSPERPIVVVPKRDPAALSEISNLHTIGCMFPYTGLHHLLFSHLHHPLLVMTSANIPGYPMITGIDDATAKLSEDVDFFLTHDRTIVNRCDDSVIRDGYIIRLSRGLAPKRKAVNLGPDCILGVGPELNANITIYKDGFCITSPHVGNVRNPQTYGYLQETVSKIGELIGARYDVIAHDLHPQFLSTRYAASLADHYGADLIPVQHHRAHIAATTGKPCIGIAIDGVGYGDDGTIWGGEIFAGEDYARVGHLESVPMPGGDLATRFPERMLYGILPEQRVLDLLASRGWTAVETRVLEQQISREFNVPRTSSTGRVLDAVAALLGLCRERTYDGEPAMKLEAAADAGHPEPWDLEYRMEGDREILLTRSLCTRALDAFSRLPTGDMGGIRDIAASFQYNLARGIAGLAIHAAGERGIHDIAISGGVAYNRMIRETIVAEITRSGCIPVLNAEYPLGDGCISFGQVVYAAKTREH